MTTQGKSSFEALLEGMLKANRLDQIIQKFKDAGINHEPIFEAFTDKEILTPTN